MEKDLRLSKPIVPSKLAADKQAADWTESQNITHLVDGDGDVWGVEMQLTEAFENELSEYLMSHIEVKLHLNMNAEKLTRSGILDPSNDYRLISLIGGATVHLEITPVRFKDRSAIRVKQAAHDYILKMSRSFSEKSLFKVKRRLVEAWVDQSGRFGRPQEKRLVARF